MVKDFVGLLMNRVRDAYPGHDVIFEGLSQDEIAAVRRAQQVNTLPRVYESFLLLMGRNQNDYLFGGGSGSVRVLTTIKSDLECTVACSSPSLSFPTDAFVFLTFYAVDYFFFQCTSKNDDPKVLFYKEGVTEFLTVSEHLSTWFLEQSLDPLLYPTTQMLSDSDIDLPF